MPAQMPVPRAVGVPSPAFFDWMRERVRAAGGDPTLIPDNEPVRFMRIAELVERSGLSEPTLYRMMARGEFPQAVPLATPFKAA